MKKRTFLVELTSTVSKKLEGVYATRVNGHPMLREYVTDRVTWPSGRIRAESCFLFLPILLVWKN
jgi:hypothetical protein